MLKFTSIFCFVCTLALASLGQSSLLNQFTAKQSGNSVYLTFTIASGITCLGIEIERSPDSTSFSTIGNIPGICGSSAEAVTYNFEDANPLDNKENFYRLLLGQVGYSETIKIHYLDFDNGVVVFPNPLTDLSTIYFPNPIGENFDFRLYDPSGKNITTTSTTNGSITIDGRLFSSGIYIFKIYNKSKLYEGKLVIQ